ncbi:cache domain-containing protein [Thauera butanivorans]|uniref:cache domain-containing protein n=1 Tax=Thauera butanivorans TaxID=86174 RepID=UPI0008386EFC|nr:cache domain-containing protein [Thauera butanivorans]
MTPFKTLAAAVSLGCALLAGPLHAADATAPATQAASSDAAKAQALLDQAEAYLRAHGDQAMAGFSRAGEFVDGELYVYVLDTRGNFLASGGSSTTLIGRNVAGVADSDGRLFFRDMIESAKARPAGQIEYRWSNPVRGINETKIASWRRVGDHILVIGYYAPHPSFELAKSLAWRAVHTLKVSGEDAFARFNSLNGGFVQDDLYVFVIGLDDGIMHAHGGQPRLIGRKATELVDPVSGRRFVKDMIDIARDKGEGEIRYTFRNPLTLKNEGKRTYVVRVGQYLVGVGTYAEPAPRQNGE